MRRQQLLQPIDRGAIALLLILSFLLGLVVWGGTACTEDCLLHSGPRVRNFSWRDRAISASDTAFLLVFSRPMDKASVEKNLKIDPPLPGKISWVGRTLAYTLDDPAPYGTPYTLSLQGARERFNEGEQGTAIQPFSATFQTRDRAFAYIGTEPGEAGRLVTYNLTKKVKTALTPSHLIVTDFKLYPDRSKIVFSAFERRSGETNLIEQKLYSVLTGLGESDEKLAGKIELIVDNQAYQNLKFDLSQDGKILVVQRINRQDPTDIDLWIKPEDSEIRPLNSETTGDFAIAPDSQTLVSAQGEGTAVFSLEPGAEPLDFLPKFGKILSFSNDGSAAAMVDFNQNDPKRRYLQSLYLVDNQSQQTPLLDIPGSIVDCQFSPTAELLYCVLTELISDRQGQYREQPYIAAIDVEESEARPLMTLPDYRDLHISLAPDGLGLLFDRIIVNPELSEAAVLRTDSGEAIAASNLWFLLTTLALPEKDSIPTLEELPLNGLHPQWLP